MSEFILPITSTCIQGDRTIYDTKSYYQTNGDDLFAVKHLDFLLLLLLLAFMSWLMIATQLTGLNISFDIFDLDLQSVREHFSVSLGPSL